MLAILADVFLKWRSDGESACVATLGGALGFALLPATGLALVALPALDAHTRLLFGRIAGLSGDREDRPRRGTRK